MEVGDSGTPEFAVEPSGVVVGSQMKRQRMRVAT